MARIAQYADNCDEVLNRILKDKLKGYKYKVLDDKSFSKGLSGVWVLYGRHKPRANSENGRRKWICLQVGESQDIYSELVNDIGVLNNSLTLKSTEWYLDKDGKQLFKHPIQLQSAAKWVFVDIKKKYTDFVFILVEKNEDQSKRLETEKNTAYTLQAKYWRPTGKPKGSTNA